MEHQDQASLRDRRVLVVDDDPALRETMAGYFEWHGFKVETACGAMSMDRALAREPVDVVLLDVLMPPGEDGLSVCRRIAASEGPKVILMSDKADDIDRIVGLELGADDYLSKPCNLRELLARIRAVMRRQWGTAPLHVDMTARFAGWRLDMLRRELRDPGGAVVELPYAEYALLTAFLERPQRVLRREQLIEYALRDGDTAADRAIDVRACRLRKALGDSTGGLIRTVRNLGYLFDAEVVFER